MPRSSLPSWALLVTIGSLPIAGALAGCDSGDSTPIGTAGSSTGTAGTAPAAGGSATAGTASVAGTAGQSLGGAAGQAGATSLAGQAGTGTGGGSAGSAGAAGTAGNAGAAGSGGGGGGASGCNGALFCDDFEAYTGTPGAPWAVKKNAQGNVIIDGAQHRSGTKAVKFTTTGADSYQQAYISLASIFPVAQNAFYGRMMIYATQAANDGVHWTMIQGEGAAAGGITNAMVRYGGQQQKRLMANYDSTGKKSDCWKHSATTMPEAKWACMEWYFDGATNTQKFWLDNTAVEDLTVTGQGEGCVAQETEGKWVYPAFSRILLGWESYQTDAPREVWIDDVAIGTSKIGCPAPL